MSIFAPHSKLGSIHSFVCISWKGLYKINLIHSLNFWKNLLDNPTVLEICVCAHACAQNVLIIDMVSVIDTELMSILKFSSHASILRFAFSELHCFLQFHVLSGSFFPSWKNWSTSCSSGMLVKHSLNIYLMKLCLMYIYIFTGYGILDRHNFPFSMLKTPFHCF